MLGPFSFKRNQKLGNMATNQVGNESSKQSHKALRRLTFLSAIEIGSGIFYEGEWLIEQN